MKGQSIDAQQWGPAKWAAMSTNVPLWGRHDQKKLDRNPRQLSFHRIFDDAQRSVCGRFLPWLSGKACAFGVEITCRDCLRHLEGRPISFELSPTVERELALRELAG